MTTNTVINTPQLTTNGQLTIGSTGARPVAGTISQGTGITVTNGAGSITIAATGGSSALVYLASATASASASVSFANVLTSTYDNYIIMVENLAVSNTSTFIKFLVGTGATPTYQTTGYVGAVWYSSINPARQASPTTYMSLTTTTGTASSTTIVGSLYLQLSNVNNATNFKTLTGNGCITSEPYLYALTWQGATVLTSFQIGVGAGTITTGTFRLYGVANS